MYAEAGMGMARGKGIETHAPGMAELEEVAEAPHVLLEISLEFHALFVMAVHDAELLALEDQDQGCISQVFLVPCAPFLSRVKPRVPVQFMVGQPVVDAASEVVDGLL
jgi:hypothetical protein